MKQILMDRPGDPASVIRLADGPEPPEPGPHQALVELVASPIHPADLLTIAGMYAASPGPMPKVPGKEGLGRVLRVGELVQHLKPGDLVPVLLANDGVWQERLVLEAEHLVALPPGGDPLQYAMGFANPATAFLLLREVVPLGLGDWVIQNAANSSVGQFLIQLARRQGIRTINIVRREGLADKLHQLGADVVLVDGPELPRRVAEISAGAPIRLAIDAVAGEASARLAACLAPRGTLCNYGMMSGKNVQVSPAALIGAGIVVRGFWLTPALSAMTPAQRAQLFGELIALLASGTIRAAVEATYPFSRVHEALAHAARGERSGKIFLVPH
ncbi:MAG: zinc-dependent alcohol dehydrogenase family protein [Bryobacteraceae bacterium]|nr:zinc-dependent alcohol dehydrogenase family protein [Bryobacteraceae bacterium]MDW8377284.1 zinc-dependent alcohol dehydrogenase family protein [Bryobacterales bacterium]